MARWITPLLLALLGTTATGADEAAKMAGEWKTTMGVLTLRAQGDALTGKLVAFGLNVKGEPRDGKVALSYDTQDKTHVAATLTLDPSGRSFSGPCKASNGNQFIWQGWHVDPAARQAKPGDFAGMWLTDLGLMELTGDGGKIKGKYALRGTSSVEGEAKGRHFEGKLKTWRFTGPVFFDLDEAGTAIYGAGGTDGQAPWYAWNGKKAPQYVKHAPLVAGKMVNGATDGLLTYTVRAPEGYKAGDGKKWPVAVVLHGANMNGAAYVNTVAATWPDVAKDYILLGINGETPSKLDPEEPAFTYSYVNFMGRSTYKGFPGTDRESPALVREALEELKGVYPVKHYFVGGHSQGGYMTYALLMHSPELVAGAFPVSGEVMMQCEPTAFDDSALKASQRAIPLAIVHGTTDRNVPYPAATHALGAFLDAGWPAVRLFNDERAGHMFGLLPVGPAIRWLEAMTGDDPAALVRFAEARSKEKGNRDAIAALRRASEMKPDAPTKAKSDKLLREINAAALVKARRFVDAMKAPKDFKWVPDFYAFRDEFQHAGAAAPAMQAFDELRRAQEEPGKKVADEALGLFRQGKRDDGFAKAQEVVDKYPASTAYLLARGWLAERQ